MNAQTTESASHEDDPRLARAINLFEFLAQAQVLRTKPVRTTDAYERDGEVMWLVDAPRHPAVDCATHDGAPVPEADVLTVKRVPRRDAPDPAAELRRWITGDLNDPHGEPGLRDELPAETATTGELLTELVEVDGVASLSENPAIRASFEQWLERWRVWANQERIDEPVRALYGQLFAMHVKLTAHPEEFELVVGIGCLAWRPRGGEPLRRHLLTSSVSIRFDENTGELAVVMAPSTEVISVELDMLDPQLITDPQRVNAVKAEAREFAAHPLDRDAAGTLARRLVYTLDSAGRYDDTDERPVYTENAVAAFAPAIILRKRSQQGILEIYRTIVAQLRAAGEVPDGILPLVDPDHRPTSVPDTTPGAVVMVDDDPFLPLPVNDRQVEIIRSVDAKAQTVVQGPPGTGKTHTAAVLISHFLAQGKRVLVAAHTDRALREVRDKLPVQVQPLSVAVVGGSREDMSNLKVAVERIAAEAADYDEARGQRDIDDALARIDELRRARAAAHRQLIESREQEVVEHTYRKYRGTLAAIAGQYANASDRFGWLSAYGSVGRADALALTNDEALEWLALKAVP